MKLSSKLAGIVLATTLITGLSGCAGNAPNAGAIETNDAFGVLADVGQTGPGEHGGRGGHGPMSGLMGGPMMGMMFKELNLTADQQAQFKTLFEQARSAHQQQGQKPDFKAMHDTLKQAFLAPSFDAAGLKAKLQQNLPTPGTHAPQMASNLIKAWQILTPEQQTKVVTKMEQMQQKMQQWQQNRPAGKPDGAAQHGPGEHLQQLAEQLQLNPDQQAKVKALWQGGQPDRQAHMQAFKGVKQQVLAELKSGNPSADKIAALITPIAQQGHQGMAQHLDKMGALHDILTPAQRQQLVTLMEQKAQQFRGQHQGQQGHERGKVGRGHWQHRQQQQQ